MVKKVLIKEYVDETGFYERLKGTKVNLFKIQQVEATTSKQH